MTENKTNNEKSITKGHDKERTVYIDVRGLEFGVHEETGEQLFKLYVESVTLNKEEYDLVKADIESTQAIKVKL